MTQHYNYSELFGGALSCRQLFVILILLTGGIAQAQPTTYYWESGAINGNWNESINWWDGSGNSAPSGSEIIRFGNNAQTVMVNDLGPDFRFRIFFDGTATTGRTIGGSTNNTFFDFGGNVPKVENLSTATHTLNFPITSGYSGGLELNASSGNLVFGGVLAGSNNYLYWGSQTVTLNGANTYTGETQINNGTVDVAGSLSGSSNIFIGNGGVTLPATLRVSNSSTWTNQIQVNTSSGTGARTIEVASSQTPTLSGSLIVNRNLRIATDASANATFSGVISGGSNILKGGTGSMTIGGSSANTNSGDFNISEGTLILNKSADTKATDDLIIDAGATVRTDAANQWGTGTPPLITNNGSLDLNDFNQKIALVGSGSIDLGTGILSLDNTGSDTYSGSILGTGGLIKSNTGTAILSGSMTYSGSTSVSGGILRLAASTASGTITIDAGELEASADEVIANTSAVVLNGGTLDLQNETVNSLTISGGSVEIESGQTLTTSLLSSSVDNTINASAGATLVLSAGANSIGTESIDNLVLNGGTLTVQDGKTLTINGTLTISGGAMALAGSGAIAYGANAEIYYHTGGSVSPGVEWTSSLNPDKVRVGASTTLDISGAELTVNDIELEASSTVTAGSQTLNITDAGSFTNDGTFTAGTGKVAFAGSATVIGTTSFYNVDLSGGVDFGLNSTVTNTMAILAGGFVNSNAPAYGASSTLQYNTGGSYGSGSEWNNNPANVLVSGTTALTLNATSGSGFTTSADFSVEGSASLDIDVPTSTLTSFFALTVGGNLNTSSTGSITISDGDGNDDKPSCTNGCYDVRIIGNVNIGSGTSMTLNGNRGDDFYVQGNLVFDGTFEPNKRAIYFEGTSAQTYTDNASTLLDFVVMDNSAGLTSIHDMRIDSTLSLEAGGMVFAAGDTLRMKPSARISVNAGYINGASRQTRFLSGSTLFDIAYNLQINPNGNTLDSVLVITTSGPDGVITTDFGGGDIREGVAINWIVKPETQPSTDVSLTFTWNKDQHTNGKDLTDMFNWKQEDGSSIWERQNSTAINMAALPVPVASLDYSSFSTFSFADGPSALPVELVEFNGTPTSAGIQLNWSTATELNNDYFEVFRSLNGLQFEQVAKVEGQGTTTRRSDYSLFDNSPAKGLNYYRLTQVDFDGSRSQSDLIAVEFWPAGQAAVFPLPFSTELNVSWESQTEETLNAVIFDASGSLRHQQVLEFQRGSNQSSLQIPDLSPGIYFLILRDENGQMLSRMPIIRK